MAEIKGNILIVDDEPNVLFFMTRVFQPMGYTTLTAQSGEDAIKYFDSCEGRFDLMIVDICMPGINGIETIKEVRKKQPELPVIVMSASTEHRLECEALGIEKFVEKPYSLEDLYEFVEEVLMRNNNAKSSSEIEAGTQLDAKVLIVDDEIEVTRMIGEALFEDFPESSFRVRGATSGEEAIKISKEFEPDIAIIDIKMPEMSGEELISRMKAGEGYCPRDFVIYTGVSDEATVNRAQALGHRVIMKPANIETLHGVLKRICLRHHLIKKKDL